VAVNLADISFTRIESNMTLNRELASVAEWAGTKTLGKVGVWHYEGDPIIEGEVQGYSFRVLYQMHRAGYGGVIMFPSISLVMDLPKPIPYHLKMRNKVGVRLNFYVEQFPDDPGPITDMPQELLDEVVPIELREMFLNPELELEYVFTISPEKIVITTFFAYRHEFYVYLLEQMGRMATALSRLPE